MLPLIPCASLLHICFFINIPSKVSPSKSSVCGCSNSRLANNILRRTLFRKHFLVSNLGTSSPFSIITNLGLCWFVSQEKPIVLYYFISRPKPACKACFLVSIYWFNLLLFGIKVILHFKRPCTDVKTIVQNRVFIKLTFLCFVKSISFSTQCIKIGKPDIIIIIFKFIFEVCFYFACTTNKADYTVFHTLKDSAVHEEPYYCKHYSISAHLNCLFSAAALITVEWGSCTVWPALIDQSCIQVRANEQIIYVVSVWDRLTRNGSKRKLFNAEQKP